MIDGQQMVAKIRQLLGVFAIAANDRSTIDELLGVASDPRRWREAHALFQRIRDKTLQAERARDDRLTAQYLFEEICAKAIYNAANPADAFDSDSAFWVFPLSITAARAMGIDERRVTDLAVTP